MIDKPPFPIDIVWSWCGLMNKLQQATIIKEHGATGLCACGLDNDMRFSMRSVCKHMPWFRRAYVVVDDKALLPKWLITDSNRIHIVEHTEIIPKKYLPTYNSHVVDSFLHRIPGLAPHFIVFDQDMYVGKPTPYADFFTPQGVPINRHYPGPTRHGLGATDNMYIQVFQHAIRKYNLDNTRFQHSALPYTIQLLKAYARKYSKELATSAMNRFRTPTDFNLLRFTTAFTSTSGQADKRTTGPTIDYFTESPDVHGVRRILSTHPQFFCINNTSPKHQHTYKTLSTLFPERGLFESK